MSKGKGTRSSTATSSTPAPVAPVSNDILPGRFTEADWQGLVEVEDGEELVGELLEEMMGGVMKVIHEKHIDEQCIPHSLAWTQNIIEKLVEWQFLAYDTGESNISEWEEDSEPERTPLDSWGRGSVPCRLVEVREVEVEVAVEQEEEQEEDTGKGETLTAEETLTFDPLSEKPDIAKLNKMRESIAAFTISGDVVESLRGVEEPPALAHHLYQAVLLTLQQDHTKYSYETFIEDLEKTVYQINTSAAVVLPPACTQLLKTYAENVQLHPDHVTSTLGGAAAKLATWLQLVYCYQLTCDELNSEFDAKMIKYCLIEMKSLAKPPVEVADVLLAVCSLISGKFMSKWGDAKYCIADMNALSLMESCDPSALPPALIKKIKRRYMRHSSSDVDKKSAAAAMLYQWCEAIVYSGGATFTRPVPVPPSKPKKRIKKAPEPEMIPISEDFTMTDASPDNMMPHQSAAIVKAQMGRPPGLKEVEYDDRGNVVSVMKINKLPSHRVRPRFEIMDPVAPKQPFRARKLKPLKSIPPIATRSGTIEPAASIDHTPIPPSFVDAMTVAPGVVVKQGTRVKRGTDGVLLTPLDHQRSPTQHLLSSN